MINKQSCFISYNRSDNDLDTIRALINFLTAESENRIEFLIDEDLDIGDDLEEYVALIDRVDAVIILLTPEYKSKAESHTKSGVRDEYQLILDRLNKSKNSTGRKTFCFVPLIFSRNFKDSCPVHFATYRALDFSDFIVTKYGEMPKGVEGKYKKLFTEICSQILAVESINKKSVEKEYRTLLDKLFFETKQDNLSGLDIGKKTRLYVKTKSYLSLRDQTTYYFLGRKGSGKTTLSHLLYLLERDSYKKFIDIDYVHK